MVHEHTNNNPFIKGMHKTEKEEARVSVVNLFSLEVPQGFIFEIPEHTGNPDYMLQVVADDGKSSFDRLEKAGRSFILHEFDNFFVRPRFFDLENMGYYIDGVINSNDGKVIDLLHRPNLIVKYFTKKKSANILQYECFVCLMGQIFQINFYFNGTKLDEKDCKTFAEGIMRSIKVISIKEKLTPSTVSEIKEHEKYTLSFKSKNRVKFDGWSILVPDNFSTRTYKTGKLLAYFDDGHVDIDDSNPDNIITNATISFFVSMNLFNEESNHDFSNAEIRFTFADVVMKSTILDENTFKELFASEPSYFIFYEIFSNLSEDGMAYQAALVKNGGLYQIIGIIEVKSDNFTFNHREYERYFLQFLNTIIVDGKEVKPFHVDDNAPVFTRVLPDVDSSCKHYMKQQAHMDRANSMSGLGATMVVNKGGTDYQFYSIREHNDDELTEYIMSEDKGNCYNLYNDANEIASVFDVSKKAFNGLHDRRNEIKNQMIEKAYMFSALRSFAWTLSDYCKNTDKNINDVSIEEISQVVNFIEERHWLNFTDDSNYKGLCNGSDLHVYYLPDSVSDDIKDKLLEKDNDYEFDEILKKLNPFANQIFSEIQSLDDLREDLENLLPVMRTIQYNLLKNRNWDEPLVGGMADILAAWCAIAIAAKEPFFSEDGPMSVDWSWLGLNSNIAVKTSGVKKPKVKQQKLDFTETPMSSIEIPETEISIDGDEFFDCENRKTIHLKEGLVSIDEWAFGNCKSLQEITIPGSVTSIGEGAFSGCKNLKTIQLKEGLVSISDSAFNDCKSLQEITIPGSVTSIGKRAFSGCKNLKTIHLKEGLVSIGEWAFGNCKSLQEITIPGSVTSIGECEFYGCDNLKTIHLKEGLVSIGDSAFNDCKSLQEITIPGSVTSIGKWAFSSCKSLLIISIPSSVNEIGFWAFYGCPKLRIYAKKNSPAAIYAKNEKIKLVIDNNVGITSEALEKILAEEAEEKRKKKEATEAKKIAKEKRIEEARIAKEKLDEELRLAEEKRIEEARIAKEKLDEELRLAQEKRKQELMAERAKLIYAKQEQEQIIADNNGWFGAKARNRKEAKAKLAEIEQKLKNI